MSTVEDSEIRRRVRGKLEDKCLPQADPVRTWAGPGNGHPCVVCEEPITSGHTEYELQFGSDSGDGLRFHRDCQVAWDAERRRR